MTDQPPVSRGLRWRRSGRPVPLLRFVGQDECTGDVGLCAHCDGRGDIQARRRRRFFNQPEGDP